MPTYFNSTFQPLVWNDEGQIVAGGDWLEVDEPTEQIEYWLARDYMVIVETDEENTQE